MVVQWVAGSTSGVSGQLALGAVGPACACAIANATARCPSSVGWSVPVTTCNQRPATTWPAPSTTAMYR